MSTAYVYARKATLRRMRRPKAAEKFPRSGPVKQRPPRRITELDGDAMPPPPPLFSMASIAFAPRARASVRKLKRWERNPPEKGGKGGKSQ